MFKSVGIALFGLALTASLASVVRGDCPAGDLNDDWIEIHNTSDEAIDVAGMYLTDA